MGNFRLEAEWVGGHGCQREKKEGSVIGKCSDENCPDCMIRDFVAKMNAKNSKVSAILRHWPGQPDEVQDDINTGIRKGSF